MDDLFDGLFTVGFRLNYRGVDHQASFGYWATSLMPDEVMIELAQYWLHPTELERFLDFPVARRRASFLAGRVLTKAVLRRDFGVRDDPRQVSVCSGIFGQPVLRVREQGFRVTVSHTAGLVCAIVTDLGVPFGVDVEEIRASRLPSLRHVLAEDLDRFSTSRGQLSEARLAFALWTQKESVGKAIHIGLTAPMAIYDLARLDWPTSNRAYAEFANLSQFACETCCVADFAVSMAFPRLGHLDRHLDQLLPGRLVAET